MRRQVITVALLCASLPALAQELRIGYGAAVTSMDPHFHALTPNMALHQHVFGSLVARDAQFRLEPDIAVSWQAIDDTTWEFKLRPGVQFHDGTPLTADDVVFSIERVATIQNSPGAFTLYTRQITALEVVDPLTVRMKSRSIFPLMPNQLVNVMIVSRAAAQGATTADFNSGRAAIGSGPYRLGTYTPGATVVLERNDKYYGEREPWQRVSFRLMTNDTSRVAALRAGDVDMIDVVPTEDATALARNAQLSVFSAPGVRNVFLYLDHAREVSPGIADAEGRPMQRNPLQDRRVRQALSIAINRDAIVRSVMGGHAAASGQLLPAGISGHDASLVIPRFDPEQARRLLADAGYPNGFSVVLAGPNDRYVNDARVLQAVAQMWTRIGVRTTLDIGPSATYFPRAGRDEYSIGMLGFGTSTGELDSPIQAVLATRSRDRGWGGFNRSGYSHPRVDALLDQALATLDPGARQALLVEGMRIAVEDVAIIPLHHQVNIWATRRGLTYEPRSDERTLAMSLRKAQ
jgi:peptide/nickel transport system substrate-binding protein